MLASARHSSIVRKTLERVLADEQRRNPVDDIYASLAPFSALSDSIHFTKQGLLGVSFGEDGVHFETIGPISESDRLKFESSWQDTRLVQNSECVLKWRPIAPLSAEEKARMQERKNRR